MNMKNKKIILFDGVCNLCNSSVQFVIDRDPNNRFMFASLQSDFGQEVLRKYHLNTTDFDSIILLDQQKIYEKSSAALRIAKELKFPWSLLAIFLILPQFLRDIGYNYVAKNRYKWFGKQESCWMPTPELRSKFLD